MTQAIVEEYITFSGKTQDERHLHCRLPIADCRFKSKIENRKSKMDLRGVLAYPEQVTPRRAVLVCSPHPHFAGDMNNNVVCAVARRLAANAVVLRFDYRGVGESEIALDSGLSVFDYWTEIEETRDYRDAIEDVESAARALCRATESFDVAFSVVGYSFGAVTGMMFAQEASRVHKMVAIAPPLGKVSFEFLSCCSKPSLYLVGKQDFLYSDAQVEAFRKMLGPAARVVVLESADHFFRAEEDMLAQKVDEFLEGTPEGEIEEKHYGF
jgi:alpha/beta superfamily hydrolase